jgi:hypothetical protein
MRRRSRAEHQNLLENGKDNGAVTSIESPRVAGLLTSHDLFDREDADAPRNGDPPRSAQAAHFLKELVPSELRVTGHQSFELTFRGTLKALKDLLCDACWL